MVLSLDQNVASLRDAFDRLRDVAQRVASQSHEGLDDGRHHVDLIRIRAQVKANVVAVRTAEQTLGTLIDTFV